MNSAGKGNQEHQDCPILGSGSLQIILSIRESISGYGKACQRGFYNKQLNKRTMVKKDVETKVGENLLETGSGEIVIYNPDESVRLDVRLVRDTVWLTLKQLATLFDRDRTVIGRHIKNIFSEGELDPALVCAKFAHTGDYGRAEGYLQTRDVEFYNLDVIISVGYRVKSIRGTRFRQWANRVLKDYLIRGYTINPRLEKLERRMAIAEDKIDFFVKTSLPPVEGIFFDGQIFDAYEFICGLIKGAKTRIILIDNYIDDTVLTMLDKRTNGVSATAYTQQVSNQFKLDLSKHNQQYPAINVYLFKKSHDRFLIIDNSVYLVGASLKDLGKKWFGINQMTATDPDDLITRLLAESSHL